MTYTIVAGNGALGLVGEVNFLISMGWKPLGGPVNGGQGFWYQAMTKWNEE